MSPVCNPCTWTDVQRTVYFSACLFVVSILDWECNAELHTGNSVSNIICTVRGK